MEGECSKIGGKERSGGIARVRTESEGKKLVVISAVTDEGLAEEDHEGKQERSGE